MTASFVRHRVRDYETWKKIFDAYESLRREHGEQSAVILRNVEDPNDVTIINTWPSLEVPRSFFALPELHEKAMQEAGVLGEPTVFVGEEVG
ncbi:cyclase [Candidatus Peregrinibacteria bacterium]|nr:cyclase [Candidatus Peregrinibacteria bacterium]